MSTNDRHPSTTHLTQYFAYEHLPPHLRSVSKAFADLVNDLASELPDGPEFTAGLRKLLEAKDCMVRHALTSTSEVTA